MPRPLASTLALLSVALLPNSLAAQQSWTLDRCVAQALESNLTLQQQQVSVRISEESFAQSGNDRLPSVTAGASHTWRLGRTIDPFTNQFVEQTVQSDNFFLAGSMTLYSGMRQQNSIEQSRYDMMASLENLERAKNDVSLRVSTGFLQVLLAQENLKIAQSQEAISAQQVQRMERLVEAGTMAEGNLLELKAQAATDQVNRVSRENELRMAELQLRQLINLPPSEPFQVEAPPMGELSAQDVAYSVDEVYAQAQSLPQIKAREHEIQRQEAQLRVSEGALQPTLSLDANIGTGYSDARNLYDLVQEPDRVIGYVGGTESLVYSPNFSTVERAYPFFDQLNDNASTAISLSLRVPIFSRFDNRTNISVSRMRVESSQYDLQIAQQTLYQDIQQAHADAANALANYNGLTAAVEANQQAFDYARQRYEAGLIDALEFNTAKNRLEQAQANQVRAKFQFLFSRAVLDFYQGKPISF